MERRKFAFLGGTAMWPLAAVAQAMNTYRVGYLALLPGASNAGRS
jgi:hypothetical protein